MSLKHLYVISNFKGIGVGRGLAKLPRRQPRVQYVCQRTTIQVILGNFNLFGALDKIETLNVRAYLFLG